MNPSQDFPMVQLRQIPGRYAVLRLPPDAPVPARSEGGFYSVTRTPEETSVVLPNDDVPPGSLAEIGFAMLRVKGVLEFNMTGIMAGLCTPLARAGVSVFVTSTFDTDYLLLRESDLETAVTALRAAGHVVDV